MTAALVEISCSLKQLLALVVKNFLAFIFILSTLNHRVAEEMYVSRKERDLGVKRSYEWKKSTIILSVPFFSTI